jgi:hypothetical protein
MSSQDNLGVFSTDPEMPVQLPAGNEVPMPGPTITDLNHIPVPYGRNVQTDDRRMGEVDCFRAPGEDPGGANIMDDRDLDDVGFLSRMDVTSIGTEKRRGGWDPLATPNGAVPRRVNTSGTRGADDIGMVPPDGSMP